jgi:hypothetical protein
MSWSCWLTAKIGESYTHLPEGHTFSDILVIVKRAAFNLAVTHQVVALIYYMMRR